MNTFCYIDHNGLRITVRLAGSPGNAIMTGFEVDGRPGDVDLYPEAAACIVAELIAVIRGELSEAKAQPKSTPA